MIEDRLECMDWDTDGYPGEFIYGDSIYVDDYYMEELWKPIDGFRMEYWVSNLARVWSMKRNQFLRLKPMDKYGHLGVSLLLDGFRHYEYIHRLVAEAFIPNLYNYPIVRHLDDNPNNNTVYNLAWGTQRDNMYDAIRNGRAYMLSDEDREKGFEKSRTPIRAINLSTGESFIFRGQGEAARILRIPQANIWKVLNHQRPRAQGYAFEYLNRGEYHECY